MRHSEYVRHDGLGLAGLIAEGQISAAEALAAARARVDAVNDDVNAVVRRMDAIADARAAENVAGVFAGVPFLLKDIFQEYAGTPSAAGSRALENAGRAAPRHAEISRRFIASGVNIFGKTNTPESAAKGVTEPAVFGVTRNPWHREHTPDGSAVAASIVPMAGASDAGGSIRIPAACRGLFGLKPGRARVPSGPERSDAMHGANLTGTPAMSVPLYDTPDSLSLGTQFVGPPGGETLLLQLAAQVEQAQPWFDRLPEVATDA